MDRTEFKGAIKAVLDVLAIEHPLGHQNAYALRYLLPKANGSSIEIMFEKGEKSPPNLWITANTAGRLIGSSVGQKSSPASKLRTSTGDGGNLRYGRHSALEKMPQLGEADLICLAPRSFEELGKILDQIIGT